MTLSDKEVSVLVNLMESKDIYTIKKLEKHNLVDIQYEENILEDLSGNYLSSMKDSKNFTAKPTTPGIKLIKFAKQTYRK